MRETVENKHVSIKSRSSRSVVRAAGRGCGFLPNCCCVWGLGFHCVRPRPALAVVLWIASLHLVLSQSISLASKLHACVMCSLLSLSLSPLERAWRPTSEAARPATEAEDEVALGRERCRGAWWCCCCSRRRPRLSLLFRQALSPPFYLVVSMTCGPALHLVNSQTAFDVPIGYSCLLLI